MIKRMLVAGAGGAPALNFIRSLKKSGERFYLIGISCNKFDLCKSKNLVDTLFLVPPARDKNYIPVLKEVISETRPHFMHVQNDEEVFVVSRYRDSLNVKTFLPNHAVIEVCQDKFKSAILWQRAGLKVPRTFLIKNRQDLKRAFKKIKEGLGQGCFRGFWQGVFAYR